MQQKKVTEEIPDQGNVQIRFKDSVSTKNDMEPKVHPETFSVDEITDSLTKISFVAKSANYIDSVSNHKHGIAFLIDTVSDKEIIFSAGYNHEDRFITGFVFTVNPRNFDIKIMEPVSGENLTIESYLKARKKLQ